MFKINFKIAIRNFAKNKIYSIINIFGLSIGIAASALILLFITDELSFDKFHKNYERIYRVVEKRTTVEKKEFLTSQTCGAAGPSLKSSFPEIIESARLLNLWRITVKHKENKFYEGEYLYAENSFFKVFDFELIKGNPETALADPKSIILTEESAKKYFGNEEAFGKYLEVENFGECRVTGILKDIPANSHLYFTLLISFPTLEALPWWNEFSQSWNSDYFTTYVLCSKNISFKNILSKINFFSEQNEVQENGVTRKIQLQQLMDIHFYSSDIEPDLNQNKGEISDLYIFPSIAFLILFIACINYINLSTARSLTRAKEIGLKKVVGAGRTQLIWQFLYESVFISSASLIIALGLIELLLPSYNNLTGKNLRNPLISAAGLYLIPGTIFIGLIAGIYPALFLTKFKPVKILKGKTGDERGNFGLRKILVTAQFAVSAALIVSAIVIYNQLNFIRNKKLGFDKNHLVVIDINSNNVRKDFQVMKNEFRANPGIKNVTVSSRVPGDWKDISRIDVANFGSSISSAINVYFIGADEEFLGAYKIKIKEGRNFSGEISDSSSILINEAAVKSLNLTDPLGKEISVFNTYYSGNQEKTDFKARVIGVVRDFHFRSLHQKIEPIVIGFWNNPIDRIDYFTAEMSGADITGTLQHLKNVGEKFDPVHPFEYNFLDERINDFYKKDQKFGKLIAASTVLAIFVAALGLLGLSLFTSRQRTKEVGIRKVLGASIPSIVMTLSKEFMILVLLSLVLSFPAAYFLLNKWLQNYAYRTGIDFLTFLAAGFMILFIAASSISIQIIKAAASNPVKSLRYE